MTASAILLPQPTGEWAKVLTDLADGVHTIQAGTSISSASITSLPSIDSVARLLSAAASTNATSVKNAAGRLYAIQGENVVASRLWLKLYNKASAPTVGTDTPVKTISLPPNTAFAFDWPLGLLFDTGIAFALTTGSADNDTGALTAGDVLGLNMDYS